MKEEITQILKPLWRKPCCRQRVWRGLRLGFGEKIYHGKPKLVDDYRGEWEIGTFYSAWRIIENHKIICAKGDTDDVEELDAALKRINFGNISSIEQPNEFDVQVTFDSGVAAEFLATDKGSDKYLDSFHIYCPQHISVSFSVTDGWTVRRSDLPTE